jgi:hypothetical protein
MPAVLANLGGALFALGIAWTCSSLLHRPTNTGSVAAFLGAVVGAYGIGGLVSITLVARLIYPIAIRLVGAPFHVGDRVFILCGRRKSRVVEVYEVWPERGRVRVRLSEEDRIQVTDVYSEHQLLKVI